VTNGDEADPSTIRLALTTVTVSAPEPAELARFYQRLLSWELIVSEPDWVVLADPAGGTRLAFQPETFYVRPVWPAGPDDQQMMMHLEIQVEDLDAAQQRAVDLGATVADFQPQQEVRVCLDPAGHPFCLYLRD
jgi:catechol 2,3-dioxygenase-like lactoylglutathione lyase family enzyme